MFTSANQLVGNPFLDIMIQTQQVPHQLVQRQREPDGGDVLLLLDQRNSGNGNLPPPPPPSATRLMDVDTCLRNLETRISDIGNTPQDDEDVLEIICDMYTNLVSAASCRMDILPEVAFSMLMKTRTVKEVEWEYKELYIAPEETPREEARDAHGFFFSTLVSNLVYDDGVEAVEFLLDFEIINVRERTRQYAAHGGQLDCIRIHLCNHLTNKLYTKFLMPMLEERFDRSAGGGNAFEVKCGKRRIPMRLSVHWGPLGPPSTAVAALARTLYPPFALSSRRLTANE